MRDGIVLNRSEQCRATVLTHLESRSLVNSEAASLLGISVRQVHRLHKHRAQADRRRRGSLPLSTQAYTQMGPDSPLVRAYGAPAWDRTGVIAGRGKEEAGPGGVSPDCCSPTRRARGNL
jgi:hypothetical protein